MAASTISFELIERVREFYSMAFQEIRSNKRKQITDNNGLTNYAIPSYILSVAIVEAFINEMFFGIGPGFLKNTSFDGLPPDGKLKLQKENIEEKILTLSELVFDKKIFCRGNHPFQDFHALIFVRDSFVHYKMLFEPGNPNIFDNLVRRNIARNSPKDHNRFWATDLCTFEGIRWAHNTSIIMINKLVETAFETNRHEILIKLKDSPFLELIPEINSESWEIWMVNHTHWINQDPLFWIKPTIDGK